MIILKEMLQKIQNYLIPVTNWPDIIIFISYRNKQLQNTLEQYIYYILNSKVYVR